MRAISGVIRFLKQQCAVIIMLASVAGLFFGKTVAVSLLLGGLLVVIPNIALALYLFAEKKKRSPQQLLSAYYIGEALKIILIAALTVLVLHDFNVKLAPLLIGLCSAYAVYFFSSSR